MAIYLAKLGLSDVTRQRSLAKMLVRIRQIVASAAFRVMITNLVTRADAL